MSCTERNEEGRCPSCSRGPIKENELIEVLNPKTEGETNSESLTLGDDKDAVPVTVPSVEFRRNDFRSSTKLDALIQNLRESSLDQSRNGR